MVEMGCLDFANVLLSKGQYSSYLPENLLQWHQIKSTLIVPELTFRLYFAGVSKHFLYRQGCIVLVLSNLHKWLTVNVLFFAGNFHKWVSCAKMEHSICSQPRSTRAGFGSIHPCRNWSGQLWLVHSHWDWSISFLCYLLQYCHLPGHEKSFMWVLGLLNSLNFRMYSLNHNCLCMCAPKVHIVQICIPSGGLFCSYNLGSKLCV